MGDNVVVRASVRFEESYEATLDEVWSLWTTPDGFEAWWGPQGFRVEVQALEARAGGALRYDMIADAPEMVAFMAREGMPVSHPVTATITECDPPTRLTIRNVIDFVPGFAPYENHIRVTLTAEGDRVRMVVLVDAHPDDLWTQRSTEGWRSQATKLPAALVRRRAR